MAQVTLHVNGTPYQLACEDGQEGRLQELAMLVDGKVTELVGSLGNIGDSKLMLMAALLLLDDATDDTMLRTMAADEEARAEEVSAAAEAIERIAAGLESA